MVDMTDAGTMAPVLDALTSVPAVIPRAELIFVPGGAAKVLDSIKDKARADAAKLDVSRPKDRKAIISLSMDLRRLKVAGDESGKTLKAEYQAKITPIDAERRVWREEMDALADEIRRPVTEFEQAEETRIREHEAAIADLVWPKFTDNMEPTSAEATTLIDALDHMHVARQWQEFADRAAHTRANSRNALLVARMNAETREKAEAEAVRIAEEAAEAARQEAVRLQAEREAEIARQAAEEARVAAERAAAEEAARVAAEAAQRAREAADALAREQEEKRQAEERAARLEAIRIADRKRAIAAIPEDDSYGEIETSAELELRLRYLRAIDLDTFDEFVAEASAVLLPEIERTSVLLTRAREREAAAAAEKARRDKIAAEALAEAQRLDAERREQAARDAAIEAERQRVEGERLREEAATRRREEDKAHRGKINREARDAIQKVIHSVAGSSSDQETTTAKAIVEALARGEIPHCAIRY